MFYKSDESNFLATMMNLTLISLLLSVLSQREQGKEPLWLPSPSPYMHSLSLSFSLFFLVKSTKQQQKKGHSSCSRFLEHLLQLLRFCQLTLSFLLFCNFISLGIFFFSTQRKKREHNKSSGHLSFFLSHKLNWQKNLYL